ncbi:MAG: DNA polymerase III subunit beta [Holosporales bacterium]|jgi:DNA polymerase-3 subunit beta|nr:DNA polymerase III subunit beta [Holosporales bacterium]
MKLSINQKILEKALSHANWIIEKKQTVPVLGYVLFRAYQETGSLVITATNMDMTTIDTMQCSVDESGSYCLPAILLYEIVRKIKPGSDVHFEFTRENNSITVKSGKASFSIHHIDCDKFPPIASQEYPISFSMNPKVLKKAIDISKVAMLQDSSRFHLNGIHVHYDDDLPAGKLKFVATDLFRIACVSVIAPSVAQNMIPAIMSKRTALELIKLIDGVGDTDVLISISENRVAFELKFSDAAKTEFSSRLVSGTFPDYRCALDVSNDKILIVNTADFIEALERVSTVVTSSTSAIKLTMNQDKLFLEGVSREFGSATDEIEASFNGFESFEICFNSKFLLDILRQIETPRVKLLLAESNSSTLIEPTDASEKSDIDMIFAIMPIEIVKDADGS